MTFTTQARALVQSALSVRLRSRFAIAAVGGIVGLGIGGAYLGGEAVQASTVRNKVERLQQAEAYGYSQEALAVAAGGLDASALSIANRHDPYGIDSGARRDRQAELLMARLASPAAPSTPRPAPPFQTGALDQSRDLDCLTRAAYYEARGEGSDGMKAVVQVVLNRVRHPAYPKSVCGVVYQGSNRATGCQFSFTCNGAMRGKVNSAAWNRARDIASGALSGQVFGAVGNATHFHTTKVSPSWGGRLVRVTQVGDHLFYRFGGRSGGQAASSSRPSPSSAEPQLVQAMATVAEVRPQAGPVAYRTLIEDSVPAPMANTRAPAPAPVQTPAKPGTVTTSTTPASASVPVKLVAPTPVENLAS